MPKIVFIEPKAPNLHIYSQFRLPRLGPFILGTLMKARGWETEVIFEESDRIDFSDLQTADLIGISTITSTAPRAYLIADRIREMGVPVLMGGPHVTFLTAEALNHADFVIRGEGERALMAFIDAWEGTGDYSDVPNLSFKGNGRIIHNPMMPFLKDLDGVPFPDFNIRGAAEGKRPGRRIIPFQTSRGCPFNCSFCSVTGMFGKKYRFRSTENVIAEMRLYDNKKNYLFIYDDNFTADRKRAKELLRRMIDEGFRFKWSTQVRADVARDPELVGLMKRAGCHTLYIGFESVNPDSLCAMKKNQTVEEIDSAIKVLRSHGIHIHGMFVFGFDEDDWETVKKTVKFAKKARLTSTQFLILTPLPGSEFFGRMKREKRLMFRDWALYDAHHVVFKPARFSAFSLQRAQIFSHRKFYSLKQSLTKIAQFKWIDVAVASYARKLNRLWKKRNKTFLKVMSLLSAKKSKNVRLKIDYVQDISLD